MNNKRSGIAALVAALTLSFSMTADAEMVRAFWAGSVTDSVSGNAYELAIGGKLLAELDFDPRWMESFSGFAPTESLEIAATFYTNSARTLMADQANHMTPLFSGEIRFLESMVWQAIDGGQIIATGTWSEDSIRFETRVVPLPAGLPLLLGALGVLTGLRRRS